MTRKAEALRAQLDAQYVDSFLDHAEAAARRRIAEIVA